MRSYCWAQRIIKRVMAHNEIRLLLIVDGRHMGFGTPHTHLPTVQNAADGRGHLQRGIPVMRAVRSGSESRRRRRRRRRRLLGVLDAVFAALVVTPAVVGYWRSVWLLMDAYAWPSDELLSAVESTAVGVVGHLLFAVGQRAFEHGVHPARRGAIVFYACSRLYTVCFAFVCVNGWRGPWTLLDRYTAPAVTGGPVAATLVVGVVALAAMRALRNVTAPPCAIATDLVDGYFEVLTMFRVTLAQKTSLYIFDCLFSVLVVGTLVVFVWRGAWVLIDIFLFPEDETLSAWASLALGYMIVAIAFLMQPLMRWLCDRLSGAPRLIAADVFLLFSLIGTVNVWRGIWNLLNIYFLPDNLELSCWITHWASLVLLILLGCSNSLLVRGVYIDAEEPAGKCVVFPCYYLRILFQDEKDEEDELEKGNNVPMADNLESEKRMTVVQVDASNHI